MQNFSKKIELSPRLKLSVGRSYTQNQTFKYTAIFCLILAIGLAGNAIRIVFKADQDSKQAKENIILPQVLGVTDDRTKNTDNPEVIEYKVQKGDTLFNLSQKYNISWATLATLNNLKSPFTLQPGQTIKIPRYF